jgi:hypothetical protein
MAEWNVAACLRFPFEVSIVEHHVQSREVLDYINSCEQNHTAQPNFEGFILYNFSFKFFQKQFPSLDNDHESVMGRPIVGLQLRDNWGV